MAPELSMHQQDRASPAGAGPEAAAVIKPLPPLLQQDRDEIIFVVLSGVALAFNSGYINGCCMSGLVSPGAPRQGVAGFTGSYTNAGTELAGGDWYDMRFHICMILSFIAGACIAGVINPKAKPYRLSPEYGPTFIVGSLFMVGASLAAEWDPEGRVFFYLAAAANGIQNGMTSIYSANLIRTCHLTGTSTDIGLIIGQLIRGETKNLWKLYVLISLALPFLLGGTVSYWAMRKFTNHALFFSAGLYLAIGIGLIIFVALQRNIPIWRATTGAWSWDAALEALGKHHSQANGMLLDVFDAIDTDHNGFISQSELETALKQIGFVLDRDTIREMVECADISGEGSISREEWLTLLEQHKLTLSKAADQTPTPSPQAPQASDPVITNL